MSVGLPIKLLHEALGHTITLELKTGELFRGILASAEDNMNVLLENVSATSRDGQVTAMQQVFLRGGQVRFIIFPDMLKHAPLFKTAQKKKGGK